MEVLVGLKATTIIFFSKFRNDIGRYNDRWPSSFFS